ncbi:hypothetical protein [Nitrosovibrio sp. Nv6]|uniref:hypothetical protein n=1 Tax=Nitrosovibrio sp. Nv6 TaxID=1855340 RepID=UPI0008B50037|nr:hypothetical protein [Nitrosovibrio sp. Nv6]SEO84193.1 hypothetical protein SAMN05216316_1239 [Nitrosovibrio sp. Nv6]
MSTASPENLSSRVSPEVFVALREYIKRKEKGYPRQQVVAAFEDAFGNSTCSTVNSRSE